jgi:hypothetical protein
MSRPCRRSRASCCPCSRWPASIRKRRWLDLGGEGLPINSLGRCRPSVAGAISFFYPGSSDRVWSDGDHIGAIDKDMGRDVCCHGLGEVAHSFAIVARIVRIQNEVGCDDQHRMRLLMAMYAHRDPRRFRMRVIDQLLIHSATSPTPLGIDPAKRWCRHGPLKGRRQGKPTRRVSAARISAGNHGAKALICHPGCEGAPP